MEKIYKYYKRILITPGIADYKDYNEGILLVLKPTIDKALNSIKGKPVVISHESKEPVGEVVDAYFDANSGDFICGFNLWDNQAKDLLDNRNYGVSSEYNITKSNDNGGTYHNIDYKQEAEEIDFVNLAIVENPRYEECKKVINSINKDKMGFFKKKNEVEEPKENKENSTETKKNNIEILIDGKKLDLSKFLEEEKEEGHQSINEKEEVKENEEKKEEENPFEARLNALEEKVNYLINKKNEDKQEEKKNSCKNEEKEEEKQVETSTKELEKKPIQNAIKKVNSIKKEEFLTRAERIALANKEFYL